MRPLPLILALLAALAAAGCRTVEGTGRKQLLLTPAEIENQQGALAYQQILEQEEVVDDPEIVAFVERVGRRIAAVAPDRGFEWEFTVIASEQVNAFALPGGKVAVYTGILPTAQHEAGLATVIGHEIAHAIARHGGERMSQGILVAGSTIALDVALSRSGVEPSERNLWLGALGLGTQLGVLLPFSRKHELEADHLGLLYMARAGYDPRAAPAFWQRMQELARGAQPPEFLSTHPHPDRRVEELWELMDEALEAYRAADVRYGSGEPVPEPYRTRPVPSATATR